MTDPAPEAASGPAEPSGRRRRWLVGLSAATAVVVLGAASVAFAFHRIYDSATIPSEDELVVADPSVVLDRDGEVVETLEPAAIRENVSLDDLPDHVSDAVLAAEDRRFHDHRGFSVRGIARAVWANLRAGEVVQGASTIHQQYVAMAVADIDDSYPGKFREAAVAARLDDEFPKDRILEMYLNTVPFGRSAIGIQAAARTYFDVDARDLDVEQAATLAGMIAAPTAFDPARNPEGAAARRDFVLDGMAQMGRLDRDRATELLGSELPELRTEPLFTFGPHAYFLDAVRDAVAERLDDQDFSSGLTIRTTLDRRAQELGIETLREQVDGIADSGAIVTVDSVSGAVRALIGGTDFETQQFNVALDGERQVGSAFKPFALAELVARGYDPDTSEVDAPAEHEVGSGSDTDTIGNYTGRGYGEVSVRQATLESINTAYVILAEELGYDRVAEMATRLGVGRELPALPSTVLGSTELTPMELTAAYATLSAEGVRNRPYLIEAIETHDGELLYEHEPDPREVLDVDTAAVITDVLADVVARGTGTAADIGRPVAGKTGTTNDYRDAWFVGYTPELTTTVWIGNRDNSPMEQVAGGGAPSTVWSAYMAALLEDAPVSGFPVPDPSRLEPFEDLDATGDEEPDEPTPVPAPTSEPEDGAVGPTEDDEGDDTEDDEGDDTDEHEGEDDGAGDEGGGDGDEGDGDGGDGGDGDGSDGDGSDGDGSDGDGSDGDGSTEDDVDDGDDGGSDDDGSTEDDVDDGEDADTSGAERDDRDDGGGDEGG